MLLLNKMLQNVLSGRVLAFCHTLGEVCTVEYIVPLEQNITIDHKMDLAISLSTTNSDNVLGKNKAIEIFGKKQEWLVKTNMARANTSG